jgi:hypothetical protein
MVGVAGVLGFSTRIGVVYLEALHSLFKDHEKTYLLTFKAVSQALNDSLFLE